MYLLKNGKLIKEVIEDSGQEITATKYLSLFNRDSRIVQDEVYTLKKEFGMYIFICTQSEYRDKANYSSGMCGHFHTKGDAIKKALDLNYIVNSGQNQIL